MISGKNTLWHESTRVPLIFAGPGINADVKCNKPAQLLDMYPTLVELAGLPERKGLDGYSLVPQLKDPNTDREWPAITTHNPGNHSLVSESWRYIHYADGSEELYDIKADPNEWHNLANDPQYADVKKSLRRHMPVDDAEPAPGSKSRLLIQKDGEWYWEGEKINPADKIE